MTYVSLAVFFAATLLPLGQTDFLITHWMKVGAFIAPTLMFFAFKLRANTEVSPLNDVQFIACLLAIAYLLHQVEEHWVDMLGREYPLYDVLNGLIAQVFGAEKFGVFTTSAIFYVNVGAVWTIAFVAIAAAPKHVFPSIGMAGLMFVNAVSHIIVAIRSAEYNSGLASSIVLFLPLSILLFRMSIRAGRANRVQLLVGISWGFLGHLLLFTGLIAANIYQLIPLWLYYSALVAYGISPLFLFRPELSAESEP